VTARDPTAKFVVFIASQPRLESTIKALTLRGVTHAVLSKATDRIATQVRACRRGCTRISARLTAPRARALA